jgi:hypothetical protein
LNIDKHFTLINARLDTLGQLISNVEARLGQSISIMFSEVEERLMERMQDMQTNILRDFSTWAESQTFRLCKLEVDHRTPDDTATQRLANVEHRLLEIEKRLLMEPPKPH